MGDFVYPINEMSPLWVYLLVVVDFGPLVRSNGVVTFDADVERMMLANQVNWDARTPIHVASSFYGLDGSRELASWFASYEWGDLGELNGVELLHLQCHVGAETVALARWGLGLLGLTFLRSLYGRHDFTPLGLGWTSLMSLPMFMMLFPPSRGGPLIGFIPVRVLFVIYLRLLSGLMSFIRCFGRVGFFTLSSFIRCFTRWGLFPPMVGRISCSVTTFLKGGGLRSGTRRTLTPTGPPLPRGPLPTSGGIRWEPSSTRLLGPGCGLSFSARLTPCPGLGGPT